MLSQSFCERGRKEKLREHYASRGRKGSGSPPEEGFECLGVGLLNDHISKKYEELTEEEIEAMIAGKFGELGEHVEEKEDGARGSEG